MKNKYSQERGSKLLKVFDKYIGIPIVFFLGIFKQKKQIPTRIDKIGILATAAIGDTIIMDIFSYENYENNIINSIEGLI